MSVQSLVEPTLRLAGIPRVMRGYWQRPAETALVLDAEGWLRTGEALHVFGVRRDPLAGHCRANLTEHKVTRQFVFCDTPPTSNVGKILRRELRDA